MFRVKVKLLNTLLLGVLALAIVSIGGCKKGEAPGDGNGGKAVISKDDVANAIEMYVNGEAATNAGYFVVFDEKAQKELKLKLDKVHREELSKISDNTYFGCAEFVTPEGDIYDVDICMQGDKKDNLAFTELMIHSVNGKERYTWYREGQIWKRKPVMGAAEEPMKVEEKPEKAPKEEMPTEE